MRRNLSSFEMLLWLVNITSRDVQSACLLKRKRVRDVIISDILLPVDQTLFDSLAEEARIM